MKYLSVVLGFFLLFSSALRASELGFIAMGDTGTGTRDQQKVADGLKDFCDDFNCLFIALLGDNFYPSGVKNVLDPQWESKFEKPYLFLKMPFFAVLGNHDYQGNTQAQIFYSEKSDKWKMPSHYYDFKRGNAHFFAIDTNKFDQRQSVWLQEKLSASDARWKFVYGHHPIFSYGAHGDNEALRNALLPILDGKADFYLAGHDHDKQVLQNEKTPGLNFVISGAGAQVRPVSKGKRTVYAASTLGWTHFRVGDDTVELKVVGSEGQIEFSKTYSKTQK